MPGARRLRFGRGQRQRSPASSAQSGGTTVTMWLVTTGPSPANTALSSLAAAFDKSHPGDHVTVNFVENQSYKQKIQLAMGAGNPPTIFWTWGGGILKQYIKAGDVQSPGQPELGLDRSCPPRSAR